MFTFQKLSLKFFFTFLIHLLHRFNSIGNFLKFLFTLFNFILNKDSKLMCLKARFKILLYQTRMTTFIKTEFKISDLESPSNFQVKEEKIIQIGS